MEKKIKLYATLADEFDYCVEDAREEIEAMDVQPFIKAYHRFKEDKEGTYFEFILRDEKDFAVVMGITAELEVAMKLAYNCDDMQSDYRMNWYLPSCNAEGDVADDFEYYIFEDADVQKALDYFKENIREYFENVINYGV